MQVEFDWTNPEKVWRVIHQWVRENAPKIIRINGLGYGWEPWLQADLADFMQQNTNARIRRETLVYGDDRRMDLTMWKNDGGPLTNYFEFKCRSEKMTPTGLAQGLQNDFAKAKTITEDRKDTRAWIMGFNVEDASEKNLELKGWTSKSIDGIRVVYKTDIEV